MLECFLKLLGYDLTPVICLGGLLVGVLICILSPKEPGEVPGELSMGLIGTIGLSIIFLFFVLLLAYSMNALIVIHNK